MAVSCLHSLLYTKTKFPIISNYVNPSFKLLQNPSSFNNNSSTFSRSLPHITRRRRTRHSSFLTFVNSNPSENLNVFVGNLPDDLALVTLFVLFMEVGNAVGAEINYDVSNQRFARITMSTFEEVEKAVNKFNGYYLEGKLLTVSREEPIREKAKPIPSTPRAYYSEFGIVIRNLPRRDVDSGRLEEIFRKYGKVESVEISYNERLDNSSGYLIMGNETEMDNAIAALNGQSLDGRATKLIVYPAISKNQLS